MKSISMKYTNNFSKVFRCGYCDLQHLFTGFNRIAFNSGVYGWNCDIFADFTTNICITTGYRNMRGDRIPSEMIEKYDNAANEILRSREGWDVIQTRLNNLRADFFGDLSQL